MNHLASFAKWLSVRLQSNWLWNLIQLPSLKLQIWLLFRARSSLEFGKTKDSVFTLKIVRELIITYRQVHCTDIRPSNSAQSFR